MNWDAFALALADRMRDCCKDQPATNVMGHDTLDGWVMRWQAELRTFAAQPDAQSESCATEFLNLLDAAKSERDNAEAALAEQEAEIARWKENAASQQASAEGCMGLLRIAIDDEEAEHYFGLTTLGEIQTFLAQHTTPPCADGG